MAGTPETRGLAREAIGSARLTAFGVSNVAPAGTVAGGLVIVVAYAGFAAPLVVLIALVASVCCAVSIAAFARRLPSAGSLYTYNRSGPGRRGSSRNRRAGHHHPGQNRAGAHYVVGDLRAWGWVVLILGTLQVIAAVAILAGSQAARWFAVVVIGLNAIGQMLFIPAYPFWSLLIIAVDVVALWGLCAYGSRENLEAAA
jgi:amino acid transporter